MKKVIALVGSRAGSRSHTRLLCEKLIKAFGNTFTEEIKSEILAADSWDIRPCLSCGECFRKGKCPQDKQDQMELIKEKLLESDIVIFASPVYAGNVSGDMKVLIDRLSLWLHIMPLIGKVGIPLCTASNSHADKVIDYLSDMLEDMGAAVPAAISAYQHFGEVMLNDNNKLMQYLKEQSESVFQWYSHKPAYSKIQEVRYKLQNKRFKKLNEFRRLYPELSEDMNEARLWYEQGYHQCESIYDAFSFKADMNILI